MKAGYTQIGSPATYSRRRKTRSGWRCRRPGRRATLRGTSMPSRSLVRPPSFPSGCYIPLISSNLRVREFLAHRPCRQEDDTSKSWACHKPQPAYRAMEQAMWLKGADTPRVLAWWHGQRRCADERARAGWAEGAVVPPRRATRAHRVGGPGRVYSVSRG
jgi:hypothetical protein